MSSFPSNAEPYIAQIKQKNLIPQQQTDLTTLMWAAFNSPEGKKELAAKARSAGAYGEACALCQNVLALNPVPYEMKAFMQKLDAAFAGKVGSALRSTAAQATAADKPAPGTPGV